jgi:hypothetical protein
MTDRKKMLYVGYIWLAVCAGGLAILGWLNLLTPSVILGSIFLIGTGFAFNAPVFSAVVPEIVSNEELPSASILEMASLMKLMPFFSTHGRISKLTSSLVRQPMAIHGLEGTNWNVLEALMSVTWCSLPIPARIS